MKTNTLHQGDNLTIMQSFADCCVDLIYIDPPYNTRQKWEGDAGAFDDKYDKDNVDEDVNVPSHIKQLLGFVKVAKPIIYHYLLFMYPRIIQMHRLLKDTGSIYLHCDHRVNHYLKLLLDDVFGEDNFRNEIAWCYTGPISTNKNYPKKHDVILFYVKDSKTIINCDAIRIPYNPNLCLGFTHDYDKKRTRLETATLLKEKLKNGKAVEDYWLDIPAGGHISKKEHAGYPTQKPLLLLERIIKASSNEGDIVLDAFCGSGTAMVASMMLERRWIGIDKSEDAIKTSQARINEQDKRTGGLFNTISKPASLL